MVDIHSLFAPAVKIPIHRCCMYDSSHLLKRTPCPSMPPRPPPPISARHSLALCILRARVRKATEMACFFCFHCLSLLKLCVCDAFHKTFFIPRRRYYPFQLPFVSPLRVYAVLTDGGRTQTAHHVAGCHASPVAPAYVASNGDRGNPTRRFRGIGRR